MGVNVECDIMKIPERTVKTAAKAFSLSPSMTLLAWINSMHMRLNPTISRRMYNNSDTRESHSIPGRRTNINKL